MKQERMIKCPRCNGTKFYNSTYGQTACEDCDNFGKVSLKIFNKKRAKEMQERLKLMKKGWVKE